MLLMWNILLLLWLVEDDNYGVYIDFDGNNGYLVMTGNYTIYALQTTGDYPEFQTQNDLYYSYIDGFLLQDENGDYVPIENNSLLFPKVSVPSTGTEDGNILPTLIDTHVQERYPSYTLESKVQPLSTTFDYSGQINTSYYASYRVDSDGNKIVSSKQAEGNCSSNSCFALLREWQNRNHISDLPEGSINKRGDIQNDPLYDTYGTGIIWLQTEDDELFHFKAGNYYEWERND